MRGHRRRKGYEEKEKMEGREKFHKEVKSSINKSKVMNS